MIESKARKSGFVSRKPKVTGTRFSKLLMFSNGSLADSSLVEMCQEFEHHFGKPLTKQSLDERFNNKAVRFFKLLMEVVISGHTDTEAYKGLLPKCRTIRIKDATSFQLPEAMSEAYPGSGGKTSKACLKIQFEYDLKSGKIFDLSIGPYTVNDVTDSHNTFGDVSKGDLIVRDLGYVGLEILRNYHGIGAFFLNRINSNVSVWKKKVGGEFEALDLGREEKQMRDQGIDSKEFEVYLGAKRKVQCRLVLICLPEKVKAEKLRKAKRAAQREGRQLGEATKARIGLNIFVTNLPEKDLPTDRVWELYRLRWQIELVFKAWKSVAGIDKIKKAKRERIECYLHAKLLLVLLGWGIFWKATSEPAQTKPLSLYKIMKALVRFCQHLLPLKKVCLSGPGTSVEMFIKHILKNCLLEKRKKNLSSWDIIQRILDI